MKLVRILGFLVARRKTVFRVALIVFVLLVAADAIPALVDKEHAHTDAERIPGFWAVFGFVGCVVLILASKAFGHCGIMTREDYYDE